ncbi:hypothetical protein BaRGS_00011988 [Batillaria attramentaria]|uniref:Uncharacterized protein n=1 Tax=Batillaria attramentaria TaxID=370345 RepID=A0ABD0LCR4_9CAEN
MVPVEGDNTSVIINPATTGFTQFEVILSNIIPDVTLNATGTFVDAGQAIGTPVGPSGCETSHIHVAMKRKTPDAASGLCYYVDPTPFLDIIQPVPQWEEECKHFTFKHIGQIVDFSNMTSGFDLVFRVLLRFSVDVGKKFLIKAVEELPDDGFLGKMREIAVDIVEGIDIKPADLKNLFKGGEENKEEKEGEGSQNSAKGFLENISSKKFSLAKILSMAQNATVKFTRDFLSKQVSKIKASIDEIIAFIKNPKPEVLGSSPTGVLRRILSSLGLSMPGDGAASDGGQPLPASLSYIAGKLNMLLAVKTSPSLCPSILKGLSASSQSTCVPDTDCLGVDCNVQFSGIPGVTENIDVSVRVLADERRVELSVAGNDYIVTGNDVANLDDMESKPLDEVIRILSDLGRDVSDIADQSTGILDAISSVMTTNEEQGPSMTSEFINPFDQKDNGSYPVVGENGELYVPFFRFIYKYPVGPCLFIMKFRAGGAFGVSFGVSVQAVDAQMQAEFKPWISGKLQADLSLSIVVAKAGIRLTGYVLKTGFPLSLSTNFKEQPLTLFKRLEVELIPIELKLVAYVEIFWIIKIRKTIWQWSADPIRGTIWEKKISKEDKEPPEFQYCDELSEHCVGRSKRQVTGTGSPCSVVQLSGRHPHDPAFKLEFSVNDEDSAFELWYAVGDYPGGTSVVDWTEMRGASLLVPAILPCGVPLYFLVRARNSQGLETTARCSIPTYDCTFPDGRVDAAYNSYGHEVVDWLPLTLSNSQPQQGASGDLRYFSPPRAGRLTSTPKKLLKTNTAIACASECLKTLTCVSFSHNEYLQDCELQEVTEGARAERRSDGHFVTYERLGKSFTAVLRYEDLPLRHGTRYYINADIENVLGYHATLTSGGTMVDFTPPEPGPVGEVLKDEMTAAGCDVSILQRCVDHVASSPNHRNIVDGEGSTAVLNGNRRGQDLIHTTENYHASVNWDGFKDEECGIHGYTFAVGTTVCGSDVVSFRDPHTSIHNPDDWTHTGVVKDIHLSDGSYYVTVQAVNDVIHGGDLVTTVCHSTPFLVDTTPPLMNSVDEVLFDETFRFLVVYYNASDVISGVARMEFGLGKTKYDARIRPYLPFEMRGENNNTYLVNEEFETSDGVPAWIRLKVVNNVDLSATGTSEAPIIIDDTPPIAGHVMDGTLLGQDVCCQNGRTEICAHYFWGVGLSPGQDDVVLFHSLSSNDKQSCVHVQLQHSMTYFSTVIANNRALNQKSANTTSGGVLIDVTPPIPGTVSDGDDVNNDINFTSKTATITTTWSDFQDPESGLTPYSLSVFINQRLNKVFTDIEDETFTDHSFSLNHGDSVNAVLLATNRAGGSVTVATDGMLVDHTSPDLQYIRTVNQTRYQLRDDVLHFIWKFEDLESGVAEYRCIVYELKNGRKTKFWPELAKSHVIDLTLTSTSNGSVDLHGVKLKNGAAYSLAVTAVNRARISTAEESMGVIVDTTPPEVLEVKLSRPDEQEEVNDDNQVEHVKGEPLWVTWDPHDVESGIEESQVCIGLAGTDDCLPSHTVTLENSLAFAVSFEDDDLKGSTDSETFLYQAYVVVTNGAGVQSAITASKPFLVLQANVAGLVLDGEGEDDLDFSYDMAAVAITFSGFSSVACGIVGYEWGVGTTPFATDVLPYSDFGLVVDDHGNGFAEAHIMQFEGQTYYSTVRAITGHNCHEEYIVSSSDGFTVDTTPPSVTFHVGTRQVTSDQVVYQTRGNKLELAWSAEDASGVNETRLTLDLFDDSPNTFLVPSVLKDLIALDSSPSEGDTIVSTIVITDNAGNGKALYLPPVTFDYSPPLLLGLKCTEAVSVLSSVLTCAWRSVEEEHSELSRISFGLGSGLSVPDLMNFTLLSLHSREWTVDTEDFITSIWITEFYVIISASNSAGLQTNAVIKVTNDVTPPADFSVRVVTSPLPGYHDKEQKCQTPQDYVEVLLEDIGDDETGISRVEMAIGSSSGRADISPFRQYPLLDGFYIMGELGLQKGSTVYVTVRVTNGVGLSTIGTSDGVVISPEPRLEVFDGPGDIDMDGQAELDVMQGSWRYSDPCPILSAEWSLRELGGKVLVDFTAIPDNANEFYDDSLSLENLKVYVNYVRIRDAMGRTFTAFSDGVTVVIRTPDVATVRDGLGPGDQDFQEPTDRLSANWDPFGDAQSTLPSDHIVRYEVAIGTDRRYSSTRSNIHAFEDVGMATNCTFYRLNLTEKMVTYFITVQAYSGAGSVIESSSDGIRVGFSADMEPGQIQVERYQGSVSSIRFWWADFVSDMIITHYYVGVSTNAPPWDNSTYACAELLQSDTFTFDVYTLQPLEADLFAVLDGLSLTHGSTYHVTLVAEDNMGHCSAAVSGEIHVDTTPPVSGKITVEGTNADTVLFLHSEQTVVVNLGDFPDAESGIKNVQVELFRSETCNPGSQPDTMTSLSMINAVNESRVTIRDLQLQEDAMYFLRVTVRNGAGLETTATSLPLILDPMPPIPGLVKLGTDWTAADRTFQNETELVRGLIALKSLNSEECITRVDLLSADAKNQWKAMGKEFSEDCVGFDVSGLHVIVQHNPHLTGVDRGAAQFSKMSWREGDYIFRLSPATGPNVLFGIALNSPSLRPPFLSQNGMQQVNQSSVSCDPTDDTCDEDTGNSTAGSSMPSDSDYGIGLSFLERDGEVQALLWAQDVLQLKQMWITLDFDPGVTEAEYILRLHKTVGSDQETWEVTAIVNGEAKAAISGLVLQMEFVISVYAWNIGGYLPPVTDPFSPFRASTIISDMSLPVDERPLCSYGSPFRDLLSGIKEVWVGVSDDFNVTANVAPYQLVSSFCLPCLRGCDDICSSCGGESLASGYSVLPVMRSGLSLQGANEAYTSFESNVTSSTDSAVQLKAAADELKQFQLPTYYLDVQVVDHSGLATDVKSTGFIVDTSPPVITSLYCTDPEYMADVEILYLGNNYTVGVNWDITEDVSSITDVILRVGSQPGLGDSAAEVHVDPSRREYVFDNLEPNLMEGQTYFVTLRAENEAGLVSQGWSNFTVQTMPTNMSDVSVTLPNVTVVTLAGKKVGLLENTERLELSLSLDAEDIDVEYYELAIGTAAGTDNVFPKTVVGSKNTTKVAIVHGFLKRDDVPSKDASIGDYTKKNYTSDTEPDPSANKFSMEPGRCLTQRLYGVNKGHVSAAVDLLPVCIKRPRDVMFEADNTTHQLRKNGNTFSVDGTIPPSSSSFSVAVTLSEGALLAGVLDDADLQDRYGTSASTELVTMPGPDIYLSPIAEAEFSEDVEVNYTVPSSVDIPDDSLVMILFWNPGTKQWEAPDELCSVVSTSFDKNTRVVSAKLCAEVFSEQADPGYTTRKKRSADDTHAATLGPRMVTVAVVRTSPVNLPPIVHNTSFTMLEDGGVHSFTIAYTDDEGDEMVFTVARQPGHGTVDVTEDGHVQYHPDPNFGGEDFIYVTGREQLDANALAMGVVPQTVNFTITVQVSHVNDPPDIFYLPGKADCWCLVESYKTHRRELLLGPTAGNGVNMSVLVEGNTTTLAVLGTVVFADKDLDDISFFDQKQETSDLSPGDPQLSDILLVDTSKASGKRITLSLADGYPGRGLYEARVKDTADAFSLQLTLDVRILLNPCFYGHCKPRDPDSTCLDQRRALTFDPYVCECDLGYEGQWCETDTDECVTSTCSPITDCVDLIGGYRCDYNPMKLAAIVVCCAVAALLGIFAFYKLKKKNAKVEPWNKCDDGELKECTFATLPTVRTETMTPPSETSSEFYDNPLFAYRPSQNPTAIRHTAAMFSAGGSAAESSAKGKAHTSRRSSQKKMVAFGSTFTPPEPAPRKTRSRSVTIETAPKVVKFDVPKNEVGPDKHHGTARSMPVSRRHSIVTIALEENRLPKVEN